MRNLFLRIDGSEHAFIVHEEHDDLSEPGKCRMVVSLNSITKLEALFRQHGARLTGRLVERIGNDEVPLRRHGVLRVVAVTPTSAASFLDATLVGGGEVTAELG